MKLLFRMLLVVFLMIGLSGGVSAQEMKVSDPIPVSFQIPEGHETVQISNGIWGKDSIYNHYRIENTSFETVILWIEPYKGPDEDIVSKKRYPLDYYGSRKEKSSIGAFYNWNPKLGHDFRYVTLDKGHRAEFMTYFPDSTYQVITVRVHHLGYTIKMAIRSDKEMTYKEKELAYKILMSLDF